MEEAGTPIGGAASMATWMSSRSRTRWASIVVGITGTGVGVEEPDDGIVDAPFTEPFAIWLDVDVDMNDGGVMLVDICFGEVMRRVCSTKL